MPQDTRFGLGIWDRDLDGLGFEGSGWLRNFGSWDLGKRRWDSRFNVKGLEHAFRRQDWVIFGTSPAIPGL